MNAISITTRRCCLLLLLLVSSCLNRALGFHHAGATFKSFPKQNSRSGKSAVFASTFADETTFLDQQLDYCKRVPSDFDEDLSSTTLSSTTTTAVDVPSETAVALHGDGGHDTIVEHPREDEETSSSLIGKKHFAAMMSAAQTDPYRMAHSLLGVSSLGIGLVHFVDVNFVHGFGAPMSQSTVISVSMLHSIVALLGCRRINFQSKKEAARNAMYWPAAIQNIWMAAICLTEWG